MNSTDIRFGLAVLLILLAFGLLSSAGSDPQGPGPRSEGASLARAGHQLANTSPADEKGPRVTLLRCDDTAVEVEVLTPEFHSSTEQVEDQVYHRLTFPNASLAEEEGAPQIPVKVLTVGIPEETDVHLSVVGMETASLFGYQVYPTPRKVLGQTSDGEFFTTDQFYRSGQWYDQDALYPIEVVRLIQTAYLRDQRVAQVEVCPLQFNPGTGELFFHRRIVLRIRFSGQATVDLWGLGVSEKAAPPRGPFESILQNTLVNYEASQRWRRSRSALSSPKLMATPTPYGDSTAYKITLSEDGFYSMSYEYLRSKGVNVSGIDPRTVKLFNRGQQVPIVVSGARDGRFDPEDAIEFWGEFNRGDKHYYDPYTHTNVYWLVSGGDMGLRMVEQDGSLMEEDPDSLIVPRSYRATLHREEDLNFERLSQMSDETIDRWLWDEIKADTLKDYSFALSAVDDSFECEVEVRLRGLTFPPQRPNHHTRIWLNGNFLDDAWWSDQSEYVYHHDDIPGTHLWEGANLLRIGNMGDTQAQDVDKIRVNSFQITYSRGYQAEDNYLEFGTPQGGAFGLYEFHLTRFTTDDIVLFDLAGKKLVNFPVVADSIFYTVKFQDRVSRPARYVALSRSLMKLPEGVFQNKASDLRATSNGADYIIIVHSDFYQSILPLAAYRQSQGLRVKVVRVEDIYDEFNDGILSPEAIRQFLQYAYENWTGAAPTYVLLVGDTSWGYDKPITHKSYWLEPCYVPTMMAWTSAWGVSSADNRLVCLAGEDRLPDMAVGRLPVSSVEKTDVMVDKVIQYESNPDIGPWRKRIQLLAGEGTTFERGCVELDSAFVPPSYDAPRIYTNAQSIYYGTTTDLIRQWDEGVAMATFTGHGGGSVWIDANFFVLDHVPLLNNGRRLPVVISLTCFVGYFDNPWYSSLGEEILRVEDKGAVAHFGSSGVAWAAEDNLLGQNLFQAIFENGERHIGIVTTQGKLGQRRIGQELIDVFNLLGDPATIIGLPEGEISLDLAQESLPMGQTISVTASLPGAASGQAEVSFCDDDTTGWAADTTGIGLLDKVFAPRIAVVQETLATDAGGFQWQAVPPDTLVDHPCYEPLSGRKAVRAYFWNSQTDAIGWSSVYLGRPFVTDVRHDPVQPLPWQQVYIYADVHVGPGLDADGPDTVKVLWGLRPETLFNQVAMSPVGRQTYRTDSTLSAQGGASIYYRIMVKYGGLAGSASTQTYISSVFSFQVSRIANLWVAKKDISAFAHHDQFQLGCWVHSTGVIDLDSVTVRFYDGDPQLEQVIDGDQLVTIAAEDSAFVSVAWEGPGEPHDVYVWVDPEGKIEQAPTFDDRAHRLFSNLFLVTPQQGTSVRGSTARVCHVSDNMGCRIAPGSTNNTFLLSVDDQGVDSAYYAQKYAPALFQQPGLSFAALRDSSQQAYGLVCQDSTMILDGLGLTVVLWYHPQDSLTGLAAGQGNLKICRFSPQIERWIQLPQQEVRTDSSMVAAQTDQIGVFGLFVLDDQRSPLIRINVEGQSFANGDYISSTPIISASIEDENGVDIIFHPIELTLNDDPVSEADYASNYSPQTSNMSLLTFAPDLDPGPYTLKVTAQDCLGNAATDSIAFNITAGFEVPFVANHPNPFQTETVFAFVVASESPADQVTIRIYTVRGRLIREFVRHNVGPGYVEVIWDGRDQDGERVANGVYYYKMIIVDGQGKKHPSVVGKMAKLE